MKLLIASPPCQAWSMAGKREGLLDQRRVFDLCGTWAADPTVPKPTEGWNDERSPLAAEPMRWAAALRPELMAWEQVPPVLDLWSHCAQLLGAMGYSTWTGILSAERYGVPQTRKRAILLASRVGQVHPPMPTHQAYVAGEPARHDYTLEGEILPWVSMAEALGWTGNGYVTDTGNTRGGTRAEGRNRDTDEPSAPLTSRADQMERRETYCSECATYDPRGADAGPWHIQGCSMWKPGFCDEWWPDVPAPTVTGGGTDAGGPEVFARGGRERIKSAIKLRANAQTNAAERDVDEPAPTIKGGHDTGDRVWVNGNRENAAKRHESEPAPTVMFSERANKVEWVENRPATTVAGDPRVHPPGHKRNSDDEAAGRDHYEGRAGENAVRVTVEEASILQSFPPDYPWQGSRTAQFQQIGNAVPPLLARAVLAALTEGVEVRGDALDLFAGPGGWDLGAQSLGIDPLGIEYDDNACKTREAAGLRTLQGDVSALDPREIAALVNPVRW